MISKVSIQHLIEHMQESMSNNATPRIELEALADEIFSIVNTLNLQIKRCASWIDIGRFVEASALSKDCDNLVLLADKLNKPRGLPAWDEFCTKNTLTRPPKINKVEVNLLNNAGSWGKSVDQLTSNWIESNILQITITERWKFLKKLLKNDEHNPIWDEQFELISGSVLPMLNSQFETAKEIQDINSMTEILQSVKALSLSHARKNAEQRMKEELSSLTSISASKEMIEIADKLAVASCEGNFSEQRALVSKWRQSIKLGGTCPERQSEIDATITALQDEDTLVEINRVQKEQVAKLERLLDQNAPCHDIEVLYYEIKEKHRFDIPQNLEERVRYVIDEEKSNRRRKTRLIFISIVSVVLITGSILTLAILKNNRDAKIAGYAHKGETCLENLDFNCYDSWLTEVQELQYENSPSIQTVISKRDAALANERRLRSSATNAFVVTESVLSIDRPDKSEFVTCKQQMVQLANSPLDDISRKATNLLQGLTSKQIELQIADTESLEAAITIASSDEISVIDPAKNRDENVESTSWSETAIKLEAIKNNLYTAINKYRYANNGIIKRAHSRIELINFEIDRRYAIASDLEMCDEMYSKLVANTPQNVQEWKSRVNAFLEYKTTAIKLLKLTDDFWTDLDDSITSAEAMHHWRNLTYLNIKSYWTGEPWLDNLANQSSAMELQAQLESYLQIHPDPPHKNYIDDMLLIVTNQTTNDGSSLLRNIKAFSDISKITLNAGRYYFGKGDSQPENHGIQLNDDVNIDPSKLQPVSIGSASIVQTVELTELSALLEQFIYANDFSTQSSIKQVLLALQALHICRVEDRIDNPILSFAACKHITEQLLRDRGETLQVLAPNYYKKLEQWNSANSMKFSTWPKDPLNSNTSTRSHSRMDAEKLVASLASPQEGIQEFNRGFNSLLPMLESAHIQGILLPTSNSIKIIGDSNAVAFVILKTRGGWIYQELQFDAKGTVINNGYFSSAPSLIYIR